MKKLFLTILILGFASMATPQEIVKSQAQVLIEQAIEHGVAIIEQQYHLEDSVSHDQFGRLGKPYFGEAKSIAVRTNHGVIASSNILNPWANDNNFQKYKGQYIPVNGTTRIIELNDTVSKEIEISLKNKIKDTDLCLYNCQLNGGFTIAKVENEMDGWAVWFNTKVPLKDYSSGDSSNIICYRHSVDLGKDGDNIVIEPPYTEGELIGGILMKPIQNGIANISFQLCALFVYDVLSGEWKVCPILIDSDVEYSDKEENHKEEEELTLLDVKSEDNVLEEVNPSKKEKKTKFKKKK